MRNATFVKVPDDLEKGLPSIDTLRFERGAFGELFAQGASSERAINVSTGNEATAAPKTLVEVVLFGKVHHVEVEAFKAKAARIANALWMERDLLLDEVRALQRIEHEDPGTWARSLRSFVAGPGEIADGLAALEKVLKGVNDPQPDPQSERLWETGVVLHQARSRLAALRAMLAARRESNIESAQSAEQYTRLVKDGAFQILLMAPNFVPVLKNPVTEFGYRISVVMIEAGASSAGALMAGTPVLREVFAVARERIPQVLIDTFMSMARAYIGPAAAAAQAGALMLLQQIVEFCFDVVLLGIDGRLGGERDGLDVLKDLAEKRLLSVFSFVLGRLLGYKPDDSRVRHVAKLLIESVVTVMAQEVRGLLKRSEKEGRPVSEIVIPELPWLMARVIQNVLLGMVRHARITPRPVDDAKVPADAKTPARDTLKLMYAQARGRRMIFAAVDGPSLPPRPAGVTKAPPLGAKEFVEHWSGLGLMRSALHTMLRSVDDGGMIIEGRVSNQASVRHLAEAGIITKGEDCKAKTANIGPEAIRGLVTNPSKETHANFDAARATWDDSVPTLKENGYLVRADRVVFHPDLLVEWSRSLPAAEKAIVRKLADKLRGPKARALFELDSPEGRAWFADEYPDFKDWAQAKGLLTRARVGITGDTDLVQVVDAVSGRTAPVGDEVKLPNSPAYHQNAARLRELNEHANSLRTLATEQETKLGREGKQPFRHGGAAERFLDDGVLEFAGLGAVFALARGEHGVIRWTIDPGTGKVSVPTEMVAALKLSPQRQEAQGRFTTLHLEASKEVSGRVWAGLRELPETHRAQARALVVRELGLEHLDSATIDRFVAAMHALAHSADERRWNVAAQHMEDARTLSLLHRIREAHRAANEPLLAKHRAPPTPAAVDAYRRKTQPRPGRLTKIRVQDRPRWEASRVGLQVADAAPTLEAPIGPRSVEAGLLVRGLTLLARENRDLFASMMDGVVCDDLADWLDAHHAVLGVDADRANVVVALRSGGNVGAALRTMGDLARRGLDGAGRQVWWELHHPVVPTTTSHLAGRLDDGKHGITDATRGLLADRLSAAETRPGLALMAFRAITSQTTYHALAGPRFCGLRLDEAWWDEARGRPSFREVRLVGRRVTVFLGTPVAVPEDGPRITVPLACERIDLRDVRNVQRALGQLGYRERAPDGVLDDETRESIATFQADADTALRVDGVAGPKTRACLQDALRSLELGEEP